MLKLYLSASTQEKNISIDNITEEDRMQQLAQDIFKHPKMAPILIKLNNPEMSLNQIINASNNWRPDFHLSLHSNAMPKPKIATGIEAWICNDSIGGYKMAKILIPKLSKIMGIKIRGDKDDMPLAKESREDGSVVSEVDKTNAPACLIELFFHDNTKDVEKFKAKYNEIVEILVDGILEYFGL